MPGESDNAADPASVRPGTPFRPGPAEEAVISLSQALLAPLDALAKAQVHAARSFLNFVLQIGYPHRSPDAPADGDDSMYSQKFQLEQTSTDAQGRPETRTLTLSLPTLALVPLQPLGIEAARYEVELVIRELQHHQQIQSSEAEALAREQMRAGASAPEELGAMPRPWYLVSEPISVRGTLSDPGGSAQREKAASIKVEVQLKSAPTPAGLAKLLSTMTQVSSLTETLHPTPGAAPGEPSSSS
ncbi:MAG: hypothetical protein DI603_14385 [Roseateles depolymerans]|uniref:DUF2589 domain-containing protein n=1 Tax=Roseateles depolymerans TaxID=76731 RepID=A0A2W5DIS2_9BURK|nr:MAG: hypothetical protein DI603_14385 [Roseateles depolymerans]